MSEKEINAGRDQCFEQSLWQVQSHVRGRSQREQTQVHLNAQMENSNGGIDMQGIANMIAQAN